MIRRSLTLATLTVFAASALTAAEPRWQDKVDPWVLDTGRAGATEFLVVLSDQADLTAAQALPTKAEKGEFVFRALTAAAARSQAPVLSELRARGVEVQPFWVVNMVWVRGDLATVEREVGALCRVRGRTELGEACRLRDAKAIPRAGMRPCIPASLPPARCAGRRQGSRSDGRVRLALTPPRTPGMHELPGLCAEGTRAPLRLRLLPRHVPEA